MATGRFLRGVGRIVQAVLMGFGAYAALQVLALVWTWGYDLFALAIGTVAFAGLAWVVGEQP